MSFRSGFVAIVGMPNVGKSTLVNALLKQKISIVTPKPQTTRNKIFAVFNEPDKQIVFVDTPGVHKAKNNLDKYMNKSIEAATVDVELILFMVDGAKVIYEQVETLLKNYGKSKAPKFLVVNKIDETTQDKLVKEITNLKNKDAFKEIVYISATQKKNFDILLKLIDPYLTDTVKYFEIDDKPQSDAFLISEVIREKALYLISEEIPHGIGIAVDSMEKVGKMLNVECTITCEKQGHKAIIIGKNGGMLKEIATKARMELEKILKTKIFLSIFVRVKENWKDSRSSLTDLGYDEENI